MEFQICQDNVVCMDANHIRNRQKCAIYTVYTFPHDETLQLVWTRKIPNAKFNSNQKYTFECEHTSLLDKSADMI